ncbi:activating signal cointegrator 1 complex subunit 1 [Narcine bancroftii]|uniref:activating signal cointegrator 1 complex subunit 1 n=1 Tax=Narcine bancroftii TaxID=1343680 RepID=UPI0038316B7F
MAEELNEYFTSVFTEEGAWQHGFMKGRSCLTNLLENFEEISRRMDKGEVVDVYLDFQKAFDKDYGIDKSIFQNPAKLHLTIGTLILLNEQDVTRACELLQKCKEDFIDKLTEGKPLLVRVKGVEYMNDDPSMVDVLYGKIEMKNGTDKLQRIADGLLERFTASGLMGREWDKVKLHATLMNTLFRRDLTVEERDSNTALGKQNMRERESFDAKNVLKKFEEYFFGEVELNMVHVSQRLSADSSGFYSSSGSIRFS